MLKCGKKIIFSCLTLSAVALCAPKAEARHSRAIHHTSLHHSRHHAYRHHTYRHHSVLQCVGFIHQVTDFQIRGNARDWWQNAAGLYARGNSPAAGAVLSFKPRRNMPLGHIAIVRAQLNNRTILIDQAHWGRNGIDRNVQVVDVSPNNNWTTVRVALRSQSNNFGSVYATHGFIYNHSERATPSRQNLMVSNPYGQQVASLPNAPNTRDIFDNKTPDQIVR